MKKFSETQRLKWRMVLVIIFCWLILALFTNLLNHLFINSIIEAGGLSKYSLKLYVIISFFIIPVAGISGGATIVFFLRERFRRYPIGVSILINVMVILSLIVITTVPGAFVYNSLSFSAPPWNAKVIHESMKIFTSYTLWYNLLFWGLIASLTLMMLHVNEKYGQGVFFNLLVGKYYRPKVENRIFMFLDITSSTTLAEKLGHEKWFGLLNDFYNDITTPIIDCKGEIYQYVGDEAVINWSLKKGLDKQNCINCFYEIKSFIQQRSKYYLQQYNVVPGFKASMHCGNVTVGEIGRIKKEIIFTGDTLNTCARILELCNPYKAELLISKDLQAQLKQDTYYYEQVAELELRGKQQPVSIYKVLKEKMLIEERQVDEG